MGGNTSSIGFALDPIISELPTTDPSTGDPVLTSIVTYLNNIASAEGLVFFYRCIFEGFIR
jgi:hypothetical protein